MVVTKSHDVYIAIAVCSVLLDCWYLNEERTPVGFGLVCIAARKVAVRGSGRGSFSTCTGTVEVCYPYILEAKQRPSRAQASGCCLQRYGHVQSACRPQLCGVKVSGVGPSLLSAPLLPVV